MFYLENHFTVLRNSLGDISALGSLSHKALSQMTSLPVYLNVVEEDKRGYPIGPDSFRRCHVI